MNIKKNIPNFITLLNLLCGSIAVIYALKGWVLFSIYLILAAAIFDFLDGFSARLLKAYSNLGKELDSLADLVSFGLAPSLILYTRYSRFIESQNNPLYFELLTLIPLLIILFSALRLAKFNVDTRQSSSFIGLPTPANAMVISMLAHYSTYNPQLDIYIDNYFSIPLITVVLSLLMVSEIPMFSLKFKSINFRENRDRYLFLLSSLLVLISVLVSGEKWSMWLLITFTTYIMYNLSIYLVLNSKKSAL